MFCNESIINVYWVDRNTDDTNAFFDCYHNKSVSLHLTEGYRYVLETEHYYISLGFDGATLGEKRCGIDDYIGNNELFDTFIHYDEDEPVSKGNVNPWIEYEYTLFVGQHLLDVSKENGIYLAHFDDFTLKIVPHDHDDIEGLYDGYDYHHVYGCERLIVRKCECGGSGKLALDFVSDYFVQCDKCKKSTCSECLAIDAIESWNEGNISCYGRDIIIK